LIERENHNNKNTIVIKPANLDNYLPIEFILNPAIIENEKIIEGWILDSIGNNAEIDELIGDFTCFGNSIPVGYLKFADIFGYLSLNYGQKIYKVIEVKKDPSTFPNDIQQLIQYTDWVVEYHARGSYKNVEAILIARDFSDECRKFCENYITMGRKLGLIKFDYSPPDFNTLKFHRII
jgi:hypothetical protein